MADAAPLPDEAEVRARWGDFEWMPVNARQAQAIIARYPPGRQASAVMPLLDLAQRQVGLETRTQGWLPVPVMEYVARQLGMAFIRVHEVATFYTMFNLVPVGRHHVQLCGTTPCQLRGSDDIMAACVAKGLKKGQTTEDGLFTLTEVECMGACANAPMVQINDDNYEDLDFAAMTAILERLARGETVRPGSQTGRQASCPEGGPTTLEAFSRPMAEPEADPLPTQSAARKPRTQKPASSGCDQGQSPSTRKPRTTKTAPAKRGPKS